VLGLNDEGLTGVGRFLRRLLSFGHDIYAAAVIDALPSVFDTLFRQFLNQAIASFSEQQRGHSCTNFKYDVYSAGQPHFFNFTGDSWLAKTLSTVNNYFRNVTAVNQEIKAIGPFQGQGGAKVERWLDPLGEFGFDLKSWALRGLDSLTKLAILNAKAPYSQSSVLSLNDLQVELAAYLEIPSGSTEGIVEQKDNISMHLRMKDVQVSLDTLIIADVGKVYNLTFLQMLRPSCLFGTINDAALDYLQANLSSFNLSLGCHSCDSPGLASMAERAREPETVRQSTDWLNQKLAMFSSHIDSNHSKQEIHKFFERQWYHCQGLNPPQSLAIQGDKTNVILADQWKEELTVLGCGVLMVICGALFCLFRCRTWLRKRHAQTQFPLSHKLETDSGDLVALWRHPTLPFYLRLVVPLMLAAAVTIMVFGHLNLAASAYVTLNLMDSKRYMHLQDFSVLSSVGKLWNAGSYALALLVGGCSVVWPYVKLLVMGLCWFLPRTYLSVGLRSQMLTVLDAVGKWSLIDVYVLVTILVTFTCSIGSGGRLLGPDFLGVSVEVQALAGMYVFLGAVVFSIFLGNVIVSCDRKVLQGIENPQNAAQENGRLEDVQALGSHRWYLSAQCLSCTKLGFRSAQIVLTLAMVLHLLGSFLPAVTFHTQGLTGTLMDLRSPGSSIRTYSFLSAALAIPTVVGAETFSALAGAGVICFCYIFFGLVMPLLRLILLFVLWSMRLTLRRQKQFYLAAEVSCAWSVLEVYLVAIGVSLVEYTGLSKSLVSSYSFLRSGPLQSVLDKLEIFSMLNIPTVYEVFPGHRIGAFVLIISCILSLVSSRVLMSVFKAAIEDRERIDLELPLVPRHDLDERESGIVFRILLRLRFISSDSHALRTPLLSGTERKKTSRICTI
jgi:hypothetical protein